MREAGVRWHMIERSWGPLTKAITGQVFAAELPFNYDAEKKKVNFANPILEKYAMNRACEKLCGFWDGIKSNGFPVKSRFIPCDASYPNSYKMVHGLLMGAKYKLEEHPEIIQQQEDFLAHLDRRKHWLLFRKCLPSEGCDTCSPWKSTALESFFKRISGCFPTPQPPVSRKGHYQTFLESYRRPSSVPDSTFPDKQEWMVIDEEGETGFCELGCPSYLFLSKEDRRRHYLHYH